MLEVKFYSHCVVCGKKYYTKSYGKGTVYSCPDCMKVYSIGFTMIKRVGQPVDFKYLEHLYDGDTCYYCGKSFSKTGMKKQIEHKTPVSRGGGNKNSNLCLSCYECNMGKFTKTEDEYLEVQRNFNISKTEVRKVLKILELNELYTEDRIETSVKTERIGMTLDEMEKADILIKNKNNKIIGFKNGWPRFDIYEISTTKVFYKPTYYGEVYNTLCRIYKFPLLPRYKIMAPVKRYVKTEIE